MHCKIKLIWGDSTKCARIYVATYSTAQLKLDTRTRAPGQDSTYFKVHSRVGCECTNESLVDNTREACQLLE